MRFLVLLLSCFLTTSALAQNAAESVTQAEKTEVPGLPKDWANLRYYTAANAKLAGTKVDVVFMGDSITNHWADAKYSTFMQDHGYVGRGISGQVTGQMLLRMPQDVFALKPKVVVFMGGTNDLNHLQVPDVVKEVEDNIMMITDLALMRRERIILCSITPINDEHKRVSATRPPATILVLNAWIKKFSELRGVPYVDYYAVLQDGHDRMKSNYTEDGLHPTSGGYKAIEPLIQKAIEAELKK